MHREQGTLSSIAVRRPRACRTDASGVPGDATLGVAGTFDRTPVPAASGACAAAPAERDRNEGHAGQPPAVSGAILAGGSARRFGGRDKSSLIVGGRRIIDRQLEVLASHHRRGVHRRRLPGTLRGVGLAVVPDLVRGRAPRRSLTALVHARHALVLVLACDLPLVEALAARAPRPAGLGTPTRACRGTRAGGIRCARATPTRCADALAARLDGGHLKVIDAVATLRLVEVGPDELATGRSVRTVVDQREHGGRLRRRSPARTIGLPARVHDPSRPARRPLPRRLCAGPVVCPHRSRPAGAHDRGPAEARARGPGAAVRLRTGAATPQGSPRHRAGGGRGARARSTASRSSRRRPTATSTCSSIGRRSSARGWPPARPRARPTRCPRRFRARRPSSSTPPSTRTRPRTSGTCATAALGDTLVRLLRFCGVPVEVQNYIDDTGVQVADVVVGFQHLEGKTLDEVRAIADTHAIRLRTAGTSTRA